MTTTIRVSRSVYIHFCGISTIYTNKHIPLFAIQNETIERAANSTLLRYHIQSDHSEPCMSVSMSVSA